MPMCSARVLCLGASLAWSAWVLCPGARCGAGEGEAGGEWRSSRKLASRGPVRCRVASGLRCFRSALLPVCGASGPQRPGRDAPRGRAEWIMPASGRRPSVALQRPRRIHTGAALPGRAHVRVCRPAFMLCPVRMSGIRCSVVLVPPGSSRTCAALAGVRGLHPPGPASCASGSVIGGVLRRRLGAGSPARTRA
jgi:hypothetical protein